jgi:hypothetical protein
MSSDTDLLRNSERFIICPVFYAISLASATTLTPELHRKPGLQNVTLRNLAGHVARMC